TVYGIVKQAGGSIDVQTECGKGTLFRVYFPETHSQPVEENDFTSPNALLRGNNETILVVEDEEEVRRLVVRILSGAGYNVVAEANGDRALARLIDQNEHVDLLLTDVIMPGMSGPELADRTGLPSVFMSGYTDQIISAQASVDENKYFVHKPFVASELVDTVQSALISAARKPLPVPSTASD
nr:response regulator [Actinomycetota bacterium]